MTRPQFKGLPAANSSPWVRLLPEGHNSPTRPTAVIFSGNNGGKIMSRIEDDDPDNPFGPDGLLRDGRSKRVSLMDSMRARGLVVSDDAPEPEEEGDEAEVEDSGRLSFSDHDRREGGPYCQPDRRYLSDQQLADRRRVVADAYAAHDKAESERWKHPFGSAETNDYTMVSNNVTDHQPVKREPITHATGDRFEASDEAKRLREAAYADAEASDRDAWKHAK